MVFLKVVQNCPTKKFDTTGNIRLGNKNMPLYPIIIERLWCFQKFYNIGPNVAKNSETG
jgi:hypothetical protein